MTELITTFCDYCNPNQQRGTGLGYAEWSQEHCIVVFGWVLAERGIKCDTCQDKDEMKLSLHSNRRSI